MSWKRIPIQLRKDQHDYLRKKAFKLEENNPKVSMSSIIRSLIDKDMETNEKEKEEKI